jgi:formamidopyrimidine-DNA glycosylase
VPELPEVETVVRDLRPLLVGRTFGGVVVGKGKLRRAWDQKWDALVRGATVTAIGRRGKWIVIDLTAGQVLLVHLGMTGQLTVAAAAEPHPTHLHLRFPLDDDNELRFRDIRRFGSADVFTSGAALEAFLAGKLGPEPFGLDANYFRDAVQSSARNLKAILLDQAIIAGVGNIYADEACFRAKLHPARHGDSLSNAEADRLRTSIEAVLTKAIAGRGSTIRDYVGGSGLRGGFQSEFAVYGRTGGPCLKCGTPVEMVRLAGRSSHYCPTCQR